MADNWYDRPLDRRAPPGGELGPDGRHYVGGEFFPFYIPRPYMPQISWADYPDLLTFARKSGVTVVKRKLAPGAIKPHQRVDVHRALSMTAKMASKPALVSREPFILDGNHRWYWHAAHHADMKVLEVSLEFERAIEFLCRFPKTTFTKET